MKNFIASYIREEDGAPASEYAVLVAIVVVVVAAAVLAFDLDGIFSALGTKVEGCVSDPKACS